MEKAGHYLYQAAVICEQEWKKPKKSVRYYLRVLEKIPEHEESLKKIEEIYRSNKKFNLLAKFYDSHCKRVLNHKLSISLHLKLARLFETQLDDTEKASLHYAISLKLDPTCKEAMNNLVDLYRLNQEWIELIEVFEKKLAICTEDQEKQEVYYQIAEVYHRQLNWDERAIEYYKKVLEIDPKNEKTILAFEELCREKEYWQHLVDVLKRKTKITSKKEVNALFFEIGEICHQKLSLLPRAIKFYQQIIKLDPENLKAYQFLHELHKKSRDEELVEIIQKELELSGDEEKKALLFELAEFYEQRLETENAIKALEQILLLDGKNLPAFDCLADIYQRSKQYENLLQLWERQVYEVDFQTQQTLSMKMAYLLQNELNDDERAREILQQTLEFAPDFAEARENLARLYRKHENWPSLINLYEDELQKMPDMNRQGALCEELGKIYHLDQKWDQALEMYQQYVEIFPDNLTIVRKIQQIYKRQENWEKLVSAYQNELEIPEIEVDRRISLLLKIAELQEFNLNDLESAQEKYSTVLSEKLDPKNQMAIRGLQRIYKETEKYDSLELAYMQELELTEDSSREVDLYLEIGILKQEHLNDFEKARECFEYVHHSRPKNLFVISNLKDLYEKEESWEKYSELVEKEIILVSPSKSLKLHEKLMRIYANHLNLLDKAVQHGEAVLELEQAGLETVRFLEPIYERLEDLESLGEMYLKETELIESSGDQERLIELYFESGKIAYQLNEEELSVECMSKVIELKASHTEALGILVEILSKGEDKEKLIPIYKQVLWLSKNQKEREDLNLKIGSIYENDLGKIDKAYTHYQIAFQTNPESLPAIQAMISILEKQEKWAEMIECLEIQASLLDKKKKPTIYYRIAELWETKLENIHQAISSYSRVMDFGFHRPTAEKMLQLYESIEEYKSMAEILEKDIRVTQLKSEEITDKLLSLGKIYWEKLESVEDSVRVFSGVLKLDKSNEQALRAMEQLLEVQEEWLALTNILKQRLKNLDSPSEAGKKNFLTQGLAYQLHRKLGSVYHDQLNWGKHAIFHYEKVLELRPKDLEVIHILQILYYDWGYYQKLVEIYQIEVELEEGEERLEELYHLIANTWEKKLFDPHQAIYNYQKYVEFSDSIEAFKTLTYLYRICEEWENLVGAFQRLMQEAQKQNDLQEEIHLLLELGKVYRDHLSDTNKAIESFERVLELEVMNEEAFDSLEGLYERQQRIPDWAQLLEEKVHVLEEAERKVHILLQLGKIYEKNLSQDGKAVESLEKALKIDEKNKRVLQGLHRLYERAKNYEKLAEIAIQELEIAKTSAMKSKLCFLLGNIYRDHFQDIETAEKYFQSAAQMHESSSESQLKLAEIAMQKEEWNEACDFLNSALKELENPSEKVKCFNQLGKILHDRLGVIEEAIEAYEAALQIEPDFVESLENLAEIYFQRNEWSKLEPVQARLIGLLAQANTEQIAQNYYRWGKIADVLGKTDEAIGRYWTALRCHSEHIEALLALGRIFWSRANWEHALQVYKRAYELKQDTENRSELLYKLGIVYEKLKHTQEAIDIYEKFIQVAPKNAEVLKSLANLYIEKENYEPSISYLEELAEFSEEAHYTLKRKAYVLDKMGRSEEGIELYLKAYEEKPEDNTIAKSLVRLYSHTKNWEKAYEWNQIHYTHLEKEDIRRRIKNRCLQGQLLWKGLENPQEAISAYKEALRLDRAHLKAIQGIANIHVLQRDWKKLAADYREFLANLPKDQKNVGIPIHLSLGHLLNDELKDRKAAIEQFESVLNLEPDHMEAHIAATELKSHGTEYLKEAIQGHRIILRRDQYRSASYRALYRLFNRAEQNDRGIRAYRALKILDPKAKDPNPFGDQIHTQKPEFIPPEIVEKYLIPSRIKDIRELLALTGEYMEKIYPANLEKKYGVRKKDHLGAEAVQRPVWYYAYSIMKTLGVKDMYMYINPKPSDKIFIENTNPPSLLISESLIHQLTEDEMRFLLCKHIFYISQKQTLAAKLDSEQLRIYFYLLRTCFIPAEEALTDEAEALQKKIRSALPRKIRKGLESCPELWENVANTKIQHYRKCLEYSANRLAFAVSDSLELALHMLHRAQSPNEAKANKISTLETSELKAIEGVSDIMMFNLSEKYTSFRKEISL